VKLPTTVWTNAQRIRVTFSTNYCINYLPRERHLDFRHRQAEVGLLSGPATEDGRPSARTGCPSNRCSLGSPTVEPHATAAKVRLRSHLGGRSAPRRQLCRLRARVKPVGTKGNAVDVSPRYWGPENSVLHQIHHGRCTPAEPARAQVCCPKRTEDPDCRDDRPLAVTAEARPCVARKQRLQPCNDAERQMMICIELALTAQLFCYSDHTFVCTDNSSLAKLIGVSACTGPDRPRVLAIPVSTTATSCECAPPDSMVLYEDQTRR
jgi:hypothetical protein